MNKQLLGLILMLFVCCTAESKKTEIQKIAESKEYYKVRKVEKEILAAVATQQFDTDYILFLIRESKITNETICELDTTEYMVWGFSTFKELYCTYEKALIRLHKKFPAMKDMSSEEIEQLNDYFDEILYP